MCSDLCSLVDLVQVGRFMTSVLSKHGSPSLCQFLICNLTVYYGGWCYSLSKYEKQFFHGTCKSLELKNVTWKE
jgi:hypothetical protein